jgi:hypothetical protein
MTTGMIVLTIPNAINLTTCPTIIPSSTLSASPLCTFSNSSNSSFYSIILTNLNSSASQIASGQNVSIVLRNVVNYYSAVTLESISMKIYYTSNTIDLVAISTTSSIIKLLPKFAYISDFKIVSAANTTLQKPVSYLVTVRL